MDVQRRQKDRKGICTNKQDKLLSALSITLSLNPRNSPEEAMPSCDKGGLQEVEEVKIKREARFIDKNEDEDEEKMCKD